MFEKTVSLSAKKTIGFSIKITMANDLTVKIWQQLMPRLKEVKNAASMQEKLNIKVGGTSADGAFTLKTVECLGACGYAPVLQCNYKFHENLTKDKVDELIEAYRSGIIEN